MTALVHAAAYGGDGWSPRQTALGDEIGSLWASCGLCDEWSRLKSVLLYRPGPELAGVNDPDQVQMLQSMEDPIKIGAGMAIALITTLYGALIANLVALPLADKLGTRSQEELLMKSIVIRGVMAIQSGDNPRVVEQKLQTFLPVSKRPGKEDRRAA